MILEGHNACDYDDSDHGLRGISWCDSDDTYVDDDNTRHLPR